MKEKNTQLHERALSYIDALTVPFCKDFPDTYAEILADFTSKECFDRYRTSISTQERQFIEKLLKMSERAHVLKENFFKCKQGGNEFNAGLYYEQLSREIDNIYDGLTILQSGEIK